MNGRYFLDTNVVVYAYDAGSPAKQRVAQDLLAGAFGGDGVISVQVLSEFYVTITAKIANPLPPLTALEAVEVLCGLPVVTLDAALVREAIEMQAAHGVSYWDGMILAAARNAKCAVLYSEDLNAGQDYGGVRVVDPFAGVA